MGMILQRFLFRFRLLVLFLIVFITVNSFSYSISVLCYHRVTNADISRFTVAPAMFERQMRYLYINDYQVLTVAELVAFMNAGFIDDGVKRIVITFDDDYPQTLMNVLPVLKRFDFRITNFIYTNFLDEINFQSHTVNHVNLSLKKKKETIFDYRKRVFGEVKKSKEAIESNMNTKVNYLAYPYGTSNCEVTKLLKLAGYKAMFSALGGYVTKQSSVDAIPRLTVFRRFKIIDFIRLISGKL